MEIIRGVNKSTHLKILYFAENFGSFKVFVWLLLLCLVCYLFKLNDVIVRVASILLATSSATLPLWFIGEECSNSRWSRKDNGASSHFGSIMMLAVSFIILTQAKVISKNYEIVIFSILFLTFFGFFMFVRDRLIFWSDEFGLRKYE